MNAAPDGLWAQGGTLDVELLRHYASKRLLKASRHPSLPLTIWNYTPECQYGRHWDEVTMICRGLVTDDWGRIVARPFPKFFNWDEYEQATGQPLPSGPFRVYEKLDGSLIIAFRYRGDVCIASRGSWTSEQAARARSMLLHAYHDAEQRMLRGITYCFEVIYPANRIVVDYGQREELVLLAAFATTLGKELPPPEIGFPIVREVEHSGGFEDLPHRPNEEGYVLVYEDGTRLKVKTEEYVAIHRLLTRTSPKTIWEMLRDGIDPTPQVGGTPERFRDWVKSWTGAIRGSAHALDVSAKGRFAALNRSGTRKDVALRIQQHPRSHWPILFAMLDGKDHWPIIWRQVRPSAEDTYDAATRKGDS